MLPTGTRLHTDSGALTVGGVLGQGGEGSVHAVHTADGEARYALKWFFEHTATDERRLALSELVRRGAPNERFLWPLGLIEHAADGTFGYLMDLRPPSYVGVSQLLSLRVPRREDAVLQMAFETAHSFLALHTQGLCYRDINFGNLFVDPESGSAKICDNDNVGIDGVSKSFVKGSPKFMAPEVLVGSAPPSKRTDQYSLAVMLFYLLLAGHPLDGLRTEATLADRAAHFRFYGYDPLFCFDPEDSSNAPHPELHAHLPSLWETYPPFIRDLFVQAFTEGLREPRRRVADSEWCDALLRLRDRLVTCACGQTSYPDPAEREHRCPSCQRTASTLILAVGASRLIVGPDLRVTGHHLANDFDNDAIATVEAHPEHPEVLGLRNDTDESWTVMGSDGATIAVEPGHRVRLRADVEVWVGQQRLQIVRP